VVERYRMRVSTEEFSKRCRKLSNSVGLSPRKVKKYSVNAEMVIAKLIRNETRCCHQETSSSYTPKPLRPWNHFGEVFAMKD